MGFPEFPVLNKCLKFRIDICYYVQLVDKIIEGADCSYVTHLIAYFPKPLPMAGSHFVDMILDIRLEMPPAALYSVPDKVFTIYLTYCFVVSSTFIAEKISGVEFVSWSVRNLCQHLIEKAQE